MNIIWGIIMIVLALISWFGQVISVVSPRIAARLGVCEAEAEVDRTFFLDQRAEAIWDALTNWVLLAAGILLLLNIDTWAYFGIIGGSFFLYFSGRGIITRLALKRAGVAVGRSRELAVNFLFLSLWLVLGAITIVLAIRDLSVA